MLYQKLALCMTDRCTASCRICCFSCSPGGKQRLSRDMMRFHIRDAANTPEVREVGFTGGEAMVWYEDLLAMAEYAKSLGLRSTVNTNGFWGAKPDVWKERLRALYNAGLYAVYFSADPYHQEYVSVDALRQAIRMALDAGMECGLFVMETEGSDNLGALRQALAGEIDRVECHTTLALPAGKGRDTIPAEAFRQTCDPDEAVCPFDGALHVNYDGNVYLCCSQFSREIPLLKRGSAGETTVAQVWAGLMRDDAAYLLLRKGPGWYYRKARDMGLTEPLVPVSECHLCRELLADSKLIESLREEIRKEADALRLESLFQRNEPGGQFK